MGSSFSLTNLKGNHYHEIIKNLYIGDNKKLSEYYSNDLEVTIVTKHNGVEAVKELMDNHEINVIISDYNLPGNNGLYLYDSIKDNKALTQLPFILVLEEYNVSVFKTAFKNGISDCFVSNKTSIEQILQRANSLSKNRARDVGPDIDWHFSSVQVSNWAGKRLSRAM